MNNVFEKSGAADYIARINRLSPDSERQWGTMDAGQMLAHLNVAYEFVYTNKHPKPNFFLKFITKLLAKPMVVGDKPYKKNQRTAPMMVMTSSKDFKAERERLIGYINKTQELGTAHFDGKESHSFGKLTGEEWNILFGKHLDHHLTQFGV